ncbi:Ypt/Rab-GAP domain of gyp1p superfamily protein [Perilla frutescens var. hirtella]|uniref:Ypt/Rab-GAP domain of gyp1p superfamily protein n=1 Tax=Perilla frutescens var. hirtella TaxID=608512 RepID=A0AAD4PB37_PERFH|nr:Ypt/Rab-GAP domain of gyp1p superfamily protein [Perilla frutescens var. hirtella]
MSFDAGEKQWKCVAPVSFQRVGSIVRDIGEPCLYQSPLKVVLAVRISALFFLSHFRSISNVAEFWSSVFMLISRSADLFSATLLLHCRWCKCAMYNIGCSFLIGKMLKPDKWQSTFDSDGKIFGFRKVLKLIILGGVDPSIRAEVWEFLLGCYSLSSTTEHRRQLRAARRERYRDLVRECQMMHSSIGTGSLAYVVGSKVMDMRMSSNEDGRRDAEVQTEQISQANTNRKDVNCVLDGNCTDKSYTSLKESSSDYGDLVCVRRSTMGGAYDSSSYPPSPDPCNCCSPTAYGTHDSDYVSESYLDFPALPFTDLFEENNDDGDGHRLHGHKNSTRRELRYEDERMHSFEINNNADLVVESNSLSSNDVSLHANSNGKTIPLDEHESSRSNNLEFKAKMHKIRISDVPDIPAKYETTALGETTNGDRVSEWLWTLHRIVVDVVRTDSHLEFYEDTKNLARMSDILAVYAWVDPATGYCQGMSDLLSPFVVLFEDDADAFWCFEMLLRRTRENFKMEGPTGVMKQLEGLWHILELTDREMFSHLSHIGAESLHFAFRMLLVLFRRELSFNEALCMWEMIWAADFDLSLTCLLDEDYPEVLSIHLPKETEAESGEESTDCNNVGLGPKGGIQDKHGTIECSMSDNTGIRSESTTPFCGLGKPFWSRNEHFQIRTLVSSTKNGDDELPVFCVAAILIMNRQKIIRETHSIDDLIKIFNDNILKIRIKRCVQTAIKLRKKYFYKHPPPPTTASTPPRRQSHTHSETTIPPSAIVIQHPSTARLLPHKVANKRFPHKNMSGSENKVAIGLSWQPKLALFSPTGKEESPAEESALYKPESQLVDGLYLPPNDPRKLNKLARKQVKDTAGKNWFDMPAQTITPELKKDLQLLKLRSVIDPKRHYKKGDSRSKTLPKYFQVGTVIESASEFFTGRLTKKERKTTIADELLSDTTFHQYRKRKVREIEEQNRPAGVDKWKMSKSKKHGKSNGKKSRH